MQSDALTKVSEVAKVDVSPVVSPDQSSTVSGSGSTVEGVRLTEAALSNDAHVEAISVSMNPVVLREGRSSSGGSTSGTGSGSEPWAWLKILAPVVLGIALAAITGRKAGSSSSSIRGDTYEYYF